MLWDFNCGAEGVHAQSRPLNVPFIIGKDDHFINLAGQNMEIVLVACELRADMPAWAFGTGMRSTAHKLYPCTMCNIRKTRMKELAALDDSLELFTDADYRAEILKHKIVSCWTYKCK